MNKSLLFLASAATLALASCSNDVMEENKGAEIHFRTAFGMPAPSSRAAEMTADKLGNLVVTATDKFGDTYFANVTFTKDGNTYTSTQKYYWPGDGSNLTFTATPAGQPDFATGFTPDSDPAHQIDVVYTKGASGNGKDNSNGVTLPFKHALAQVEIRAINSNTSSYTIEVVNSKIGNIHGNGKFDMETAIWSNYSTIGNYSNADDAIGAGIKRLAAMPEGPDAKAPSMMFAGGNAMVLPQTLTTAWNKAQITTGNTDAAAYLGLKVRIKTAAGAWVYPAKKDDQTYDETSVQEFAWVAVPVAIDWKAGKKYIYTLEFGEGAGYTDPTKPDVKPVLDGEIKVKATVEDWVEQNIPNIPAK